MVKGTEDKVRSGLWTEVTSGNRVKGGHLWTVKGAEPALYRGQIGHPKGPG